MTSTTKHMIQLNEDAIFFLREGDHPRTMSAFLNAFVHLDSLKAQPSSSQVQHGKKRLAPMTSIEIPESENSIRRAINSGNDLFTCYNKALTVENDDSFEACVESKTRFSALLQFNLALAHHRRGLEQNNTSELTLALQLYEGAYFTIERVKERVHMEDVFLLLLGIFFNMTHIHCNFFNLTECQHCMDWMKVALASRECVSLREDDYIFFSTNISLLAIQLPHLAPAA